jgi:hypothetical protein
MTDKEGSLSRLFAVIGFVLGSLFTLSLVMTIIHR